MAETPPHIRVLLDAIKDSHGVATATGMLQPTILGGLVNLWELCWRAKEDLVDEMQLRGCFGPFPPELIRALIAFNFLEAHEAGQWRVRGAEELLRISRQKSEAGKERARQGLRDKATGRMLPRVTEPLVDESSECPADRQHITSVPPARSQPTTKPPNHPSTLHPSTTTKELADEVVVAWERFQDKREAAGYGREAQRPARFATWLQDALSICSLDDLLAAYEQYLDDASIKNRTHPTAVFMKDGVWSTRIPPPAARSAPTPAGAPASDPAAAEIWQAFLQQLRLEKRNYILESLGKFVPCALDGDDLTLWGPDQFLLGWMADQCRELLVAKVRHRLFVLAPDTPRRPLFPEGEA